MSLTSAENTNYVQSRVGMWLSVACAIHCVLTPILFLAAPAIAREVEGLGWIDWFTVVVASVLTMAQLIPEYRYHHKPQALRLAVTGLAFLVSGLLTEANDLSTTLHTSLMVVGSLCMAAAFYKGHRLRHHAAPETHV